MNHIAQTIPAGHRIRLSISSVYWPLAWTPPEDARLTLWTRASRLNLPVRPPRASDEDLPDFGDPVSAPPPETTTLAAPEHTWRVSHDLASQVSSLEVTDDRGRMRFDDIDLTVTARAREVYSARGDDFASARGETEWWRSLSRGSWSVSSRTRTVLRADRDNFHIDAELDACEGDVRQFSRSWSQTIPRDLV